MECVQLEEFVYTGAPAKLATFESKAAHLRSFKCFSTPIKEHRGGESKDAVAAPKWGRFRKPQPVTEEKRPIKFVTATTEEGLARKEFLPLMNKLTLKNKVSILNQVRRCMKTPFITTYVNIVWDTCLDSPSYQNLYIEVLDIIGTLGQDQLRNQLLVRLDNYFNKSEYLTPAEFADASEPEVSEGEHTETYDEFCASVKWKKRALGTVSLLILLEQKGLLESVQRLSDKLLESSNKYLESGQYELVDSLLEQLLVLYTTGFTMNKKTYTDNITGFVQHWLNHVEKMKLSTKFKFYSFAETLERNSRSVNRWTSKTRLLASLK
jgi:hypothetical protein